MPTRTARMSLALPIRVDDLLAEEDPPYNWLVPDLLEYGDRVIITGNEGMGKSTLLRQMALRIAAGLWPWPGDPDREGQLYDPRTVLFIDLENSKKQVRRELQKIRPFLGEVSPELYVCCWPAGIDITEPSGAAPVTRVLDLVHPELVILSPMYKMAPDLQKEDISKLVASQLDQWRTEYNCALMMESHQPHRAAVGERMIRPTRPFGSSLWLRWPEFGECLLNDGHISEWRGARDERDWPEKLHRAPFDPDTGALEDWPWVIGPDICLYPGCGKVVNEPEFDEDGAPKRRTHRSKYCSEQHANAARQARYRLRHNN